MEEVSTRRASLDDYGATTYGNGALSSSIMEATMHDVMTIEMSHHDVADSYLDPRSFGGLNSYDDYNGSHPSSYSTNSSSTSSSSTTSFESSTSSQTTKPSYSSAAPAQQTSSSVQSKFDNSTRFDSQLPPPSQRRVPTYPVKTANPATCTQYAPARTIITVKSTRRAQSRTAASKKETLDPQRLEDEVARNVSQIMSATKQQRLIQEAQIKNGIIPTTKAFFNCPECGKGMTSQRNLQRHRQSSCNKRFSQEASPVRDDESSSNIMIDTDIHTPPLVALPGVDTFSQNIGGYNMVSEMNDWCSTESYSPVQSSQNDHLTSPIDNSESLGLETASHVSDNCLPPLSLETDDSRTHSSSASHCSSNSGGNSVSQGLHTCGSCKKSVCSLRSLKRHFTTCKQFIADHGPPENDLKPKVKSRRKPKAGSDKENEVASLESMNWSVASRDDEVLMMPSTSTSSLSALSSSSSSSISDSGSSASDMIAAVTDGSGTNVCVDCSRQLCSASNLKRHRATCKAALQNSRLGATSRSSSPATPPSSTEEKEVPPQTVTRNSSTRFTEQRVTRQSQATAAANILLNDPELQQKPWITVGEHLRAQHHKAKLGDSNSRDVESAGSPTSCIASTSTTCAVSLITSGTVTKLSTASKQSNNAVSTTTGLNCIPSSQVSISSSNLRAATAKSRNSKTNSLSNSINNNNNNNNIHNNGNTNAANSNNNNTKASNARVTYYKLDSMRPVIVAKPKSDAYGDTTLNNPKNNRLNTEKVSIDPSKKNNNKKDDVARNSDQTKKWKIAQVPLNGESAGKKKPLESIITTQPLSDERLAGLAEPMILPDNRTIHRAAYPGHDFQCPECKKNYSCRKNVKRHRMAVHKLTAEEVSQFPAVACTSAVQVPNKLATLSTVAATTLAAGTRIPVKPQKISTKYDYQTEMIPLSPLNDKPMSVTFTMKPYPEDDDSSVWCRSSEYDEETAETARIAAELKRSAEQEVGEYLEKRPRTELAEADTTFSEETEHSLVRSHHSSPGVHVSSSYSTDTNTNAQSLPTISSWIDSSKPLTVDIPPLNATRSENSSPALRQRRQYSTDSTTRVASSEYGRRPQQYNNVSNERSSAVTAPSSLFNENLKNNRMNSDDPLLGHNVLNSLSRADDDWFRSTEEVPDSTTNQRLKFVCVDRSTSPGHPDQGNSAMLLPMTRNRTSSGSSSNGAAGYASSDPKQARHLCQWRPGTTTNSVAHQHDAASKRPANDDSSNTYLWSSPTVPSSKASNHLLAHPTAIISDAMDLTTPDCMSFSIALAGLKTASSSATSATETNSCGLSPSFHLPAIADWFSSSSSYKVLHEL